MADSNADTKVANALAERLRVQLGATYRIQFTAAPAITPDPDAAYLVEAYMPARSGPVGMAFGSSDDHRGLYQVMVLAPRDQYKAKLHAAIAAVRGAFVRGLQLAADDLSVLVENTYAGSEVEAVGARIAFPVTVEWRSFA